MVVSKIMVSSVACIILVARFGILPPLQWYMYGRYRVYANPKKGIIKDGNSNTLQELARALRIRVFSSTMVWFELPTTAWRRLPQNPLFSVFSFLTRQLTTSSLSKDNNNL